MIASSAALYTFPWLDASLVCVVMQIHIVVLKRDQSCVLEFVELKSCLHGIKLITFYSEIAALLEGHLYGPSLDSLQNKLVDECLLIAFLKNIVIFFFVCISKLYFSFLFALSLLGQSDSVLISPSVSSAAALPLWNCYATVELQVPG